MKAKPAKKPKANSVAKLSFLCVEYFLKLSRHYFGLLNSKFNLLGWVKIHNHQLFSVE